MGICNQVFIRQRNRLVAVVLLLCGLQPMLLQEVLAQTQPPETIYNTDWNERLAPNLGLKAHDHNLLGDSIDLHTGRLSFEHVDLSIPGNSDLR
jgi:hypothetical protein